MATLVLSAAGMALGGSVGGSVLGLSMAAVGRFAGAAIGRSIDQRLLGSGSDAVEHGRIDRFRLTGASEGAPLPVVHGRMRVAGQIIWASRFQEHTRTSGGGKGAPSRPKVTEYSYTVSIAVALCAGQISRVGRIWADGIELAADAVTMHVHDGAEDQSPDGVIEAVEGIGKAPAYRGVAYVVFEDIELGQFGNRIPQFTFEVHRPGAEGEDMARAVRGVALIPGTGEYSLATEPVTIPRGFGEEEFANIHTPDGRPDFTVATEALDQELPNCQSVSLVVSWFGDDLRCGSCRLRPLVEQTEVDSDDMPWSVAGITRAAAGTVPGQDRPLYGGTPCDASVVQAIEQLRQQGKDVVFYPFILMEQIAGNTLPNPWTGSLGQPTLPWRGRITTDLAPGVDGSSQGTAAARAEVDAFFDGPEGFRAFILHYARLCAQAGGVKAFCIGSEMVALTQIRDDQGYPAVERLRQLAAEVRDILPGAMIGYAADWSEYHGHQPVGTNDKLFHLDALWADENIDFIGIDNYMPLSDWRDGDDHADADWGDIRNLEYLKSNVAGGELYDWYYHSDEAREAQIRTPITDGHGEDWVWRIKDLKGWWSHQHHNRIGGERAALPTAWVPGSKPIWFTEYGCAAIDKGTNQPNKFLDPKSSESQLPHYSSGERDDYIQVQYVRAVTEHFADEANNPVSSLYGGPMVDMSRAHVWAWDARPWPAFPSDSATWSDGGNYDKGHWLNGRASTRTLAGVVSEICAKAGVTADTSRLHGIVRGYTHDDTETAREALQPLMLVHGFDAVEVGGSLSFRSRVPGAGTPVDTDGLALVDGSASPKLVRSGEAEVPALTRVAFTESDGAYETRVAEAVLPGAKDPTVSGSEVSMALTSGEGQAVAERWLGEARIARDGLTLALPPSARGVQAGDILRHGGDDWRVDRIEDAGARMVEAVRVEPALYRSHSAPDVPVRRPDYVTPARVAALFLDLPVIGEEGSYAPHVAMGARPWPGDVALMSSPYGANFEALHVADRASTIGVTLNELAMAPAGLWDRGAALRVKLTSGRLQGRPVPDVLAGANLAAIGDGSPGGWEVFQFVGARLTDDRTYDVSLRLRGQAGTDGVMRDWPAGSRFVLLDSGVAQLDLSGQTRGVSRQYQWGPARRPMGDATWQGSEVTYQGVGLRPYPVAHLRDHGEELTWIRRTRVDGDGWDGVEVPLGEEVEAYRVTVYRAGEPLRTQDVSEPRFAYAAAARGGDGADAVGVAQLSQRFGPGPERQIVLMG